MPWVDSSARSDRPCLVTRMQSWAYYKIKLVKRLQCNLQVSAMHAEKCQPAAGTIHDASAHCACESKQGWRRVHTSGVYEGLPCGVGLQPCCLYFSQKTTVLSRLRF
jgi:hypothetical protein